MRRAKQSHLEGTFNMVNSQVSYGMSVPAHSGEQPVVGAPLSRGGHHARSSGCLTSLEELFRFPHVLRGSRTIAFFAQCVHGFGDFLDVLRDAG